MNLQEIIAHLDGEVLSGEDNLHAEVTGGYVGDLLSCVMAGAKAGNVWVTIQSHPNIVAVAVVAGLAAIVVAEGTRVDESTLERARLESLPIVTTPLDSFSIVGALWEA